MKNVNWKIAFALLTLLIGLFIILSLIMFTNNSSEIVVAQSDFPEIKASTLLDKTPEPPSENETSVNRKISEAKDSIHDIKDGDQFCEKYLLKKVVKEKDSNSRVTNLKIFNTNDKTLSPNIKKWLENMQEDILLATEVKNTRQKALLLSSRSYGATGLATNLENWHIEIDGWYSDQFWSFSKNPNLIFWDKDGLLNYYSVIYSDEFLSASSDRDFEKLTFNIERYKINSDGKTNLISEERNMKCE